MLFQNDSEDLYIHAPVNVTRGIKSEFKNGVYTIVNNNLSGTPAKLYIVVKDLKSLKATGKVNIITPTNIYTKALSLNLSDEVNATLYLSSDDLALDVRGSGHVLVSGEVDTLRLKTEGSGDVSFDIKCHKVFSTLKSESETIFEGSIFYLYSEVYQYAIIDNSSTVTGTCIVSTYDNGMAKLRAEDQLFLHAGDRSTIIYRGEGKVEIAEKDKKASIRPEVKNKGLITKLD